MTVPSPAYHDARCARMALGDLPGRPELHLFQLMRSGTPHRFALRFRFGPAGTG